MQDAERKASPPGNLSRHLLPLAIIWLLALLYLAPSLFFNKVPLPVDVLLLEPPWKAHVAEFPWFHKAYNPVLDVLEEYYPWREFGRKWLHAGRLPLWNPLAFCGAPFLANGQSALAYPFSWLFALVQHPLAYGLFLFLHLGLAGSFAYLLPIILGRSRTSALVTGLIFAFAGFFMAWLEYFTFISSGVWLPASLAGYETARTGKVAQGWTLASLALGFSILGGHLQVAAYVFVAFVLWVVVQEIERCNRNWPFALRLAIGNLLVGTLIAAVQLLPSVELGKLSARLGTVKVADLMANALPLKHLLALAMPFFFGDNFTKAFYWGHFNFVETCAYAGVVTLLLAALAIASLKKPQSRIPGVLAAGVIGVIGLLWAFRTGFAVLIYWLLPPFRQLPNVGRAVFLLDFALALLAGAGLEYLLRERPDFKRWAIGFLGAGAIVIAASYSVLVLSPLPAASNAGGKIGASAKAALGLAHRAEFLFAVGVVAAVAVCWCLLVPRFARIGRGVLVALVVLELAAFGMRLNPQMPVELLELKPKVAQALAKPAPQPAPRFFSFGKGLHQLRSNLGMVLNLADCRGYDSLYPGQYEQILTALKRIQSPKDLRQNLELLRALGVQYVICEPALPDFEDMRPLDFAEVHVYELEGAAPLAEGLPEARVTATRVEALAGLKESAEAKCVLLAPDAQLDVKDQRGGAKPAARIENPSPDCFEVELEQAGPTWLVLREENYPGWCAYAGVKKLPVHQAWGVFQAVRVPAGEKRITFVFRPVSFLLGLYLSLLGLALVMGALAALRRN